MPLLRRIFVSSFLTASALAQGVNFGPAHQIANAVTTPVQVVASDLDGDGDLDLIAIENQSYSVAIWENTGKGVYRRVADEQTPNFFYVLGVADLDGDGKADLLASKNIGTEDAPDFRAVLIHGSGLAGFTGPQTTLPISAGDFLGPPRDLDGDGSLDLLTRQGSWLNDGHGNFSLHVNQTLPDEVFPGENNLIHSYWADNDGTGREAVFFATSTGLVRIGLHAGDGTFQFADTGFTLPSHSYLAGAVKLPDLAASACLLVTEYTDAGQQLQLYVPDGASYRKAAGISLISGKATFASATVSVQMDHGQSRIFVSINSEIHETPGASTFQPFPPSRLAELLVRDKPSKVSLAFRQIGAYRNYQVTPLLADVNGDGNSDVVVWTMAAFGYGAPSSDGILWQAGSRSGVFSRKQNAVTRPDTQLNLLYAGDLDGDGSPDLLTTSAIGITGPLTLTLWRNSGQAQSFKPKVIFNHGKQNQVIAVKKRAGQTTPEVYILSSTPARKDGDPGLNELTQLSFTKAGRVQQRTLLRLRENIGSVGPLMDVDHDGIDDLRVLKNENGALTGEWFRGVSPTRFEKITGPSSLPSGSGFPFDVDWDGDLDDWDYGQWIENDGTAAGIEHAVSAFDSTITVAGQEYVVASIVPADADFDGDGHPDYLVTLAQLSTSFYHTLPILARANGDHSSTTYPLDLSDVANAPLIDGSQSISWLDLNGDGLVDVIYPAQNGHAVTYRLNLGGGKFSSGFTAAPGSSFDRNKFLTADLDGDGIPDLISTSASGTRLEWFKGQQPIIGNF